MKTEMTIKKIDGEILRRFEKIGGCQTENIKIEFVNTIKHNDRRNTFEGGING